MSGGEQAPRAAAPPAAAAAAPGSSAPGSSAPAPSAPAPQPPVGSKPPVEVVLKWVAAVAAVLSLVAGSFQVMRLVSDVRERKRFIVESLDVASRQRTGSDYASAWTTLEGGVKSADEGGQLAKLLGQLSEERQHLRGAQEELAMDWLRNLHVPAGRKFSDFVDRVLPVLDRGAATTQGIARADRIAHIGWAYYLRLRDGPATLDPPAQYKLALQADPDNPYAHAFWGHWMVVKRESLADAMAHFDAAAKNPATLGYVRTLEMGGLRGRSDAPAQAQLLRVLGQMLRNGESIDPGARSDAYSVYNTIVREGALAPAYTAAMSTEEHLALIEQFAAAGDAEPWRVNVLRSAQALFEEQANETSAALATWRGVRANLGKNEMSLRARVEAAIKRLEAAPVNR